MVKKYLFILFLFLTFPFLQVKEKIDVKKKTKDKIIFSNNQSTTDYLDMFERSLKLLRTK